MFHFPSNAHGHWRRTVNGLFYEPVPKRSSSVKIEAGDHFNRRHPEGSALGVHTWLYVED
jgi:hypothetical protein